MMKRKILASSAAVLAMAGAYAGVTATASSATDPAQAEVQYVAGATSGTPDTISVGVSGHMTTEYVYRVVATCPTGYVAVSAGDDPTYADTEPDVEQAGAPLYSYYLANVNSDVTKYKAGPIDDGSGWQTWHVSTSSTDTPTFTVVCVLGVLDTP
jgi:hypothetical protein